MVDSGISPTLLINLLTQKFGRFICRSVIKDDSSFHSILLLNLFHRLFYRFYTVLSTFTRPIDKRVQIKCLSGSRVVVRTRWFLGKTQVDCYFLSTLTTLRTPHMWEKKKLSTIFWHLSIATSLFTPPDKSSSLSKKCRIWNIFLLCTYRLLLRQLFSCVHIRKRYRFVWCITGTKPLINKSSRLS